ncbi:aldo/keto reductase [Streptomyces sp. NPDC002788]
MGGPCSGPSRSATSRRSPFAAPTAWTTPGPPGSASYPRGGGDRGVSPQRVGLAWLLTRSPTVLPILPIPGASRPETVRDSAAGADLPLTPEERARLDAATEPVHV